MKRVLILVLVATFSGCDSTPSPEKTDEFVDLDPGNLTIDIERNNPILDSIHEIAMQTPGTEREYPASPAQMNEMLRAMVWQYNYERALTCMHGYLPKHSCGAPYLPAWIHEKSDVAPSLATLRARDTELGIRVEEFWDAACDEAKPRLKHDDWFPLCSIE